MAFDPSGDFADVVDGLEAVTLLHRGSDSESISNALRREVTTREALASNGKYTTADTRWHFPVSVVSSYPRIGDVIEDSDSEQYTILEVQKATLSRRYKCVCRNVAVVYGLDDWLTIEKATYSKGTQGALERTWTTWKKVRARIQPVASAREPEAGMQKTVKRYTIVLATDATLGNTYRFKGPNGTYYRFEQSSGDEDVAGMQTVEATQWRS